MKKRSCLIVAFDGLRRDRASAELMPNLAAFMKSGTDFVNSRSVFPSETRVAITSLVTGTTPRQHGLVANQYLHPAAVAGRPFQTARYEDLIAADAIGQLIDRQSLGERLAAAGKTMAVVSTASPGATWMMHHKARTLGHPVFSVHGMPISTPQLHEMSLDRLGPIPAASAPDTPRIDYACSVLTEIVYPTVNPDLCIFWMSDPDTTSHAFGIMSEQTEAAQRGCDAAFGHLLDWWRSGSGPENLIVMSDHGHVTGVSQVDPGKELQVLQGKLSTGSFNGLYLDDTRPEAISDAVRYLTEKPWCGLVFADSTDAAPIDGAFPWATVGGGHQRGPTIGFTLRATLPIDSNAAAEDSCLFTSYIQPGDGMHGGLNRGELSNVLAASGPAFAQGQVSVAPCWLPDIAPTLLSVLGVSSQGTSGRVLSEALANGGSAPDYKRRTLTASLGDHEQGLEQWLIGDAVITDYGWSSSPGAWCK